MRTYKVRWPKVQGLSEGKGRLCLKAAITLPRHMASHPLCQAETPRVPWPQPGAGMQHHFLTSTVTRAGEVTLAYNTAPAQKARLPTLKEGNNLSSISTSIAAISIYEKTEAFLQCFQIAITVRTMVYNDAWLDLTGVLGGDQTGEVESVVCTCQWYSVIKGWPAWGRT